MMIEIKGLTKSFGDQVVLRNLDLTIGNETVGLLGANGSGKTTLIKCILGLLDFDGEIRVNDQNMAGTNEGARLKIGYIPQYLPIWPDVTVNETMSFFAELRQANLAKRRDLLGEFGLVKHAEKKVGALSGGMRQKLSIAIALLSEPSVLLLDEPTANLDAWATCEVLQILQSWRGKKTVVLSSHRLEEVQAVSDRLIQVGDGKVFTPDLAQIGLVTRLSAGGRESACALS